MEARIRPARDKDGERLEALDRLWESEEISPGLKPRKEKDFRNAFGKGIVVVAELDGAVIGYALGTVKKSNDKTFYLGKNEDYLDLDSEYVMKQHRCAGVGSALVRSLITKARKRGLQTVLLSADNKVYPKRLIDFYEKLGFKILFTSMKLNTE